MSRFLYILRSIIFKIHELNSLPPPKSLSFFSIVIKYCTVDLSLVPLAQGQHGFPSGEGSVCSGTQDGICSQRHLLKTGKLLIKKKSA